MLDPFNTRSLAFQLNVADGHIWRSCPACTRTACSRSRPASCCRWPPRWKPRTPRKLTADKAQRFERALMRFSSAVGDRYFLQGASAVPTVKLMGLA